MSPERQRVVIAELCGWDDLAYPYNSRQLKGIPSGQTFGHEDVPDYTNDLNAIHEAEKRIPASDRHNWYLRLSMVVDRERRMASVPGWLVPTATAAQRAEALLRTLNKWEDS